jgi:hypothetical protein
VGCRFSRWPQSWRSAGDGGREERSSPIAGASVCSCHLPPPGGDDGAVKNTWLRVTVKPTAHTGLTQPDVFSFGNLVGETGDGNVAPFRVSALDLSAVKRALNTTSDLAGRVDFNRDGRVNALDLAVARGSLNRSLGTTAGAAPFAIAAMPTPAAPAAPLRHAWDELTDGDAVPS